VIYLPQAEKKKTVAKAEQIKKKKSLEITTFDHFELCQQPTA
jgi:hypothetical protein